MTIFDMKSEKFALSTRGHISEYVQMLLFVIGVVGLTTICHSFAIPLYKLNPMHWTIYLMIIYRKPSISSLALLAFALPFTSLVTSGHPVFYKALVMGIELIVYGIVFSMVSGRYGQSMIFAFILSQITGRSIYYLLKWWLLSLGLLTDRLVSTEIGMQFVAAVLMGSVIFIITEKNQFQLPD